MVGLQLAALLVLGAVTVFRFHIWADIDERPHYDYIQKLVEGHRIPRTSDLVSRQVQALTDDTWPKPSWTDPASIGIAGRSYEAIQPPLYYAVAGPAFAAVGDYRDKVFAVRAFDLALMLCAVWLLWRLARHLAPRDRALRAFAVVLAVLLWPGVVVRSITIGNTPLELVLATAFMVVLWRADDERRGDLTLVAAVLLGLCLLTKLALVCLVPLFLIVLARRIWRMRRGGKLWSGEVMGVTLVSAGLPIVMLAPWLAGNYARYSALNVNYAGANVVGPSATHGAGSRFAGLLDLNARLLEGVLPQEWESRVGVWWIRVAVDVLAMTFVVLALALLVVKRRDWRAWFLSIPFLSGVLLINVVYVVTDNDAFLLRYIYAALLPFALSVGLALDRRHRVRRALSMAVVVGWGLVTAALWVDMAGSYYFTNVGRAVGI